MPKDCVRAKIWLSTAMRSFTYGVRNEGGGEGGGRGVGRGVEGSLSGGGMGACGSFLCKFSCVSISPPMMEDVSI
jgi:hypothetical protein